MGNILQEVVAAFSALIVLLLADVSFGDLINNILTSFVQDALFEPSGALLINYLSLKLTLDIILMGWKVFLWFVSFAVIVRMFVYCGFFTEEQGVTY